MIFIYGGNPLETSGLDSFRYDIFKKKVVTSTSAVRPEEIPPTAAAYKYHSFRAYLQVFKDFRIEHQRNLTFYFKSKLQVRKWLNNSTINPLEWGWELLDGIFHPTMTDLPPAPRDLLKIIKCACNGTCETLKCTCRKNEIDCSTSCKNCKGIRCRNSHAM